MEMNKEIHMKMKNQRKAGFTLVELMVVAIIVAILAAVAIPLMSGNKNRAIATEAQAGCSTVASALKVYWAEHGSAKSAAIADVTTLPGINTGDLVGKYFNDSSYSVSGWTGSGTYTIKAVGKTGTDADGGTVTMTVTAGDAVWSGFGQ
jgi:type IV pilus assembly protein PilA